MSEMKPFVTLQGFDGDEHEMTEQAEFIVNTDAQAIELWQYLRMQATKWLEKNVSD